MTEPFYLTEGRGYWPDEDNTMPSETDGGPMTELAKHIAQRVMQFLVADPDRITHSIEEVAEIIDSAGVRELTEQHKMDQFWNEEARQVSVRHAKDLEDLTERVRELTAQLEAEIENRKGWQIRAADAEAKIYHSETPCEGESPDPPINLRELTADYQALKEQMLREVDFWQQEHAEQVKRGRELTEALDQAKLTFFFGKMEYDLIEAVLARIEGEK